MRFRAFVFSFGCFVFFAESFVERTEEEDIFLRIRKTRGAHARENRKNESRCTTQRKRESRKEGKRERISKCLVLLLLRRRQR